MASTNGTAPPTQLTPQAEAELGSMDTGPDRLFSYTAYNDGVIWNGAQPSASDYAQMLERDGKAAQLEQVLTLPLRWAGWSIEPGRGDKGETEFVREALTSPPTGGGMSTPFDLVLAQLTSGAIYRKAFFEKVFQVTDGKASYRKLAFRSASTCKIQRHEKTLAFEGFTQRVPGKDEPVLIRTDSQGKAGKAFVYLHAQHKDPLEGHSDALTCWRVYETKQKIRFLWMHFLEDQVLPKALATVDQGGPDEAKQLATRVSKLKGGGVAGLVQGESVDVFESNGKGASEFVTAMDWLSAEQSASVLAQFTDLAQQGSGRGSLALSQDQSDFFLRSRQAVLTEMAAQLTWWVVAPLVSLNFPDPVFPTFRFNDLAEHDAEATLKLFESFASSERQNPAIPGEFMDALVEKTAHHLGMDVDAIRKALEARPEASPEERVMGGVDAAARLVAEAKGAVTA